MADDSTAPRTMVVNVLVEACRVTPVSRRRTRVRCGGVPAVCAAVAVAAEGSGDEVEELRGLRNLSAC